MTDSSTPLDRLVRTVADRIAEASADAPPLAAIAEALGRLVAEPGWLAEAHRRADPHGYRRIPLFEDLGGRFSVGCFVWGPGQASPVHDHRTWGVVGVLDGPLKSEEFRFDARGRLRPTGEAVWLPTGTLAAVDPRVGDIHRLTAPADRAAISIHVYGGRFDAVNRNRYDDVAIDAAA